jgi:hypothetical protein
MHYANTSHAIFTRLSSFSGPYRPNPHTHKAVHEKARCYWAGYIEREQFLAAARPDIELAFFKAGLKREGIPLSPLYEQVYIYTGPVLKANIFDAKMLNDEPKALERYHPGLMKSSKSPNGIHQPVFL